eukprot:scaffold85565_cov41-Phaeocystis_antarctica.AAC.1
MAARSSCTWPSVAAVAPCSWRSPRRRHELFLVDMLCTVASSACSVVTLRSRVVASRRLSVAVLAGGTAAWPPPVALTAGGFRSLGRVAGARAGCAVWPPLVGAPAAIGPGHPLAAAAYVRFTLVAAGVALCGGVGEGVSAMGWASEMRGAAAAVGGPSAPTVLVASAVIALACPVLSVRAGGVACAAAASGPCSCGVLVATVRVPRRASAASSAMMAAPSLAHAVATCAASPA